MQLDKLREVPHPRIVRGAKIVLPYFENLVELLERHGPTRLIASIVICEPPTEQELATLPPSHREFYEFVAE